jgi:hypothetical protein
MGLNVRQCELHYKSLKPMQQALFLAQFGHKLSLLARQAYEIGGSGVADPKLLRDLNDITHRIFSQVAALLAGKSPPFDNDVLVSWLVAEGKPHLHDKCLAAFERVISYESIA